MLNFCIMNVDALISNGYKLNNYIFKIKKGLPFSTYFNKLIQLLHNLVIKCDAKHPQLNLF